MFMYMFILITYMYVHVHTSYIHVCTCISIELGVLGRPTKENQLFVCALTSISSSQPKLSLLRNLHPPYPYQVDVFHLQRGWSMYTGQLILSCVGCQPNRQSGLVRTCRRSLDFQRKLTRGRTKLNIHCRLMLLTSP
jgi:hypothetical protein